MASERKVFNSVFPRSRWHDLAPTPSATPILSQGHFVASQPRPAVSLEASESFPEPVIWDRSWHTATTFLSLPPKDFIFKRQPEDLDAFAKYYNDASRDVVYAIRYLIVNQHLDDAPEPGGERESLIEWYTDHVRRHFQLNCYKPILRELEARNAGTALLQLRDSLDLIQSIYTHPLTKCVFPHLSPSDATRAANRFRGDLHALSAYALPNNTILRLLSTLLSDCSTKILGLGNDEFELRFRRSRRAEPPEIRFRSNYALCEGFPNIDELSGGVAEPADVKNTRSQLLSLLKSWSTVGLSGYNARKAFAAVLDQVLTKFVKWSYKEVVEEVSGGVIRHLHFWITNVFSRFVVQVLNAFKQGEGEDHSGESEIALSDVQRWKNMAITRLGELRTDELFDTVMTWDEGTHSRIDDLKHFVTNPSTRKYVTSQFISVLSARLLQPGVPTLYILRIYICIIQAFRRLDPKGVLLDRVARPVRRYLRDRNDTLRVIVWGLLSGSPTDTEALPQDPQVLTELSNELKERGIETLRDEDGEIDWNNMQWVPDPIDAASDYRKSKNSDVIGSLMSLFESKDAIVKELQVMLSDRLLMSKTDFEQEYTVLELLKIRFGEATLQSCLVMLRDVKQDSAKIDQTIRRDQGLDSAAQEQADDLNEASPDLHAKILSHLFWPTLQDQSFRVPTKVLAQQHLYEKGYTAIKNSRKLTWLNALGQVELELEFQDRVFKGEVTPWEASVIHVFDGNDSATPVTRTVDEIAAELEMASLLVRSACKLWLSKSVLAETVPDTYQVLETLPDGVDLDNPLQPVSANVAAGNPTAVSSTSAAAAQAATLAASSASESVLQQKMAVYHQFILSLLTNQGAMPLPRIVMMLGMVVPGGFPFSNDELKEFLNRMMRDGEIEMGAAGAYRAVTQT